ncbi:MAG: hypothetical protein FWB75_03815 [Oscillospiraceae bacterium]|nr:hypothetical protein [Oscillospiraceae bacterium]
MKKYQPLDPAHFHQLTEQECELIAYIRMLGVIERRSVMQLIFAKRDEGSEQEQREK